MTFLEWCGLAFWALVVIGIVAAVIEDRKRKAALDADDWLG